MPDTPHYANGTYQGPRNVLGGKLASCSTDPMTGFFRTGCCDTNAEDQGVHTVCIVATEEFLEFSKLAGNDLSTPHPEFGFPGVRPGDRWCLCAARWQQALQAGMPPKVVLEATHERTLSFVTLQDLQFHAADS